MSLVNIVVATPLSDTTITWGAQPKIKEQRAPIVSFSSYCVQKVVSESVGCYIKSTQSCRSFVWRGYMKRTFRKIRDCRVSILVLSFLLYVALVPNFKGCRSPHCRPRSCFRRNYVGRTAQRSKNAMSHYCHLHFHYMW